MSLRRQLLMVSLLLLALPWAGCQFVREIEGTMREGQVQSLQATTSAIATALRDRPRLLYPDPRRAPTLPADDGSIYAHPSDVPIIVDGYADGWEESHRTTLRGAFDAAELTLHYQAQTRNGNLYLLFQVEDADVVFNNPELSREANGDRLMLQTWLDDKRQRYVIATSAPGAVRAKFDGRRHPGVNPARIRGVWQDSTNGYTIELEIPLSMTGERLGFYITNASSGAGAALDTVGNTSPLRTAAPPWLIYSPDTLHKALEPFGHLGGSLSVFDRGNFQLGKASSAPTLAEYDETSKQETFWLIKALYRSILAEDPLLTEVCEAYRSVYNKHKIHLDCAEPRAQINGSPDLLVQALDKLVDNAASFSTPGDTIVISLNSDDGHWQIAVSNRGPNLPEDLQTRLFEPMVSLREADGEGRMHLGLGLHVVRLIAQHFQGSVSAQNLPDGSGVRITLEFPKA